MPDAICNTSPFLYLYRIGGFDWLPRLSGQVWVPSAVAQELQEGLRRGDDVPDPYGYAWVTVVDPRAMPSEWLALDLGPGELAAMSLALENPERVVLLDDMLARQRAQAAGLVGWGTLKVLLEAEAQGFIAEVRPFLDRLSATGMWLSADARQRALSLAGEASP